MFALLAALQLLTPGCVQPFSALDIGSALERERIGSRYRKVDTGIGDSMGAQSGDKRITVITFGCRGDYVDEINQEDAETREGKSRMVRYVNEAAMAIVVFTKPPTAREGVVTQATLDALTP